MFSRFFYVDNVISYLCTYICLQSGYLVFSHSFSHWPFHIFTFVFISAISFVVNSFASASDNETASDKQAGSLAGDDDDDDDFYDTCDYNYYNYENGQ